MGSTRALTDNTETPTDTYTFDAFGTLIDQTGTTPNNYLYSGEQFDSNIALYYLRARYYDYSTGRFVTTDPFEGRSFEPVTLHRYLYSANNPVMFVDPSGKMTLAGQMTTLSFATLSVLTHLTFQNCLQNTRTSTRNRNYEYEDIVYRGLRKGIREHRFLVRLIGISSKGYTEYSPSEHIEETRDDTIWISTTASKKRAIMWATRAGSSGYVAIINLRKIPDIFVYDTRIPGKRNELSEEAKRLSGLDEEVLIFLHINFNAIKGVVHYSGL